MNWKVFHMHGEGNKLTYKSMNIFSDDQRDILFFSGPPHLLKTIWNALASTNWKLWVSATFTPCLVVYFCLHSVRDIWFPWIMWESCMKGMLVAHNIVELQWSTSSLWSTSGWRISQKCVSIWLLRYVLQSRQIKYISYMHVTNIGDEWKCV